MRIFVPPDFAKQAVKARISDDDLSAAVDRAERGLIDAQLGLCLIKQRLPRRGRGRSAGFRTIVAYERGTSAVFLHLFAKNAKANLSPVELDAFRTLAGSLMRLDDPTFSRLAKERGWRKIAHE